MRLNKFLALLVILTTGLFATVAVAEVIIVTSPPMPRPDIVMQPQGYERCYHIPAGWYHGVWVPDHRVCQYSHQRHPKVWVTGYWKCNRFNPRNGYCAHWMWVPAHWSHRDIVF